MRSATSFFNKTLIRTDVRRYWPLLFVYTGIWMIMLPVYQWVDSGARYGGTYYPGDHLYNMMFGGMIMAVIFCGLFTMAAFSYLMNGRSVGLMHALPVTRGEQFVAHVSAILAMLASGKLLVALVTALLQALRGDVDLKAIALWFAVVTLVEFFFLALGVLCAMVTGWLLAMPVVYAAANVAALAVTELLRALCSLFYFGYDGGGHYNEVTRWLTPVYQMGSALGEQPRALQEVVPDGEVISMEYGFRGPRVLGEEVPSVLVVYTIVAIVMLVLAYVLYTRRASESAGDPVAFRWMRPFVRYAAALVGGLAMGLGLYAMVSMNDEACNLGKLMGCMVLMGVLCYFAGEMVISKSFRVFGKKGWLGAGLAAVILILVVIGAKLDLTGYEKRVPAVENIQEVEINLGNENVYINALESEEAIAAAVALHSAVVAEGMEPGGDEGWYNVRMEYTLKDGNYLKRYYRLSMTQAEESKAIYNAVDALINCREVRYKSFLGGQAEERLDLEMRGGYITDKYNDKTLQLTAEEAQRLYEALLTDLANGAGGHKPMSGQEYWDFALWVELEPVAGNRVYFEQLTPDFENTVAELNAWGWKSEELFMVDKALAEKYGW